MFFLILFRHNDVCPILTQNVKCPLLLLLLLSHFSCVWLCVTPETATHQASLSLGFSRKEYWSGLPFPSPVQEREKGMYSLAFHRDSLPVPAPASSCPLCPKTRPVLFSCFNPPHMLFLLPELTFPMSSCGHMCSSSRPYFKCRFWRGLHRTPWPRSSGFIPWPHCCEWWCAFCVASPRMEGRIHLFCTPRV